MAHTPGPWVVFHADADGPNDVLPAGRPGHIALGIENVDDARLIALVPHMLSTLKLVRLRGATFETLGAVETILRLAEPTLPQHQRQDG